MVYEAGMEEVAEESLPPEVLLKTAVVQTMIGFWNMLQSLIFNDLSFATSASQIYGFELIFSLRAGK